MEAPEVLEQAKHRHDATIGICWDVLAIHADDLSHGTEQTPAAGAGGWPVSRIDTVCVRLNDRNLVRGVISSPEGRRRDSTV